MSKIKTLGFIGTAALAAWFTFKSPVQYEKPYTSESVIEKIVGITRKDTVKLYAETAHSSLASAPKYNFFLEWKEGGKSVRFGYSDDNDLTDPYSIGFPHSRNARSYSSSPIKYVNDSSFMADHGFNNDERKDIMYKWLIFQEDFKDDYHKLAGDLYKN